MERSLDYKGRWRNYTVAFRVSDEEAKLLNDLVALSGLTKQESAPCWKYWKDSRNSREH